MQCLYNKSWALYIVGIFKDKRETTRSVNQRKQRLKDQQWSTSHHTEKYRLSNTSPTKFGGHPISSGKVNSSFTTSVTCDTFWLTVNRHEQHVT